MRLRTTLLALAAACVLSATPAHADQTRAAFSFAVIGDAPYFAWEALRMERMLDTLNQADLAFILHVGDLKSGRDLCDDRVYEERLRLFQRSQHPFVLLPGDNDWTDCSRPSNGGYVPLERLAHFRAVFYPDRRSLGQRPMALERQSDDPAFEPFRENMRWRVGGVLFAAAHVVGSGNDLGNPGYAERNRANLAWLTQAFDLAAAAQVEGLVVAIHGDPLLESRAGSPRRAGFDDFVQLLEQRAATLGKPVLLIHGDSHQYRWDRPRPSLQRLESFGSPDVGWVRVTVQASTPGLFSVEPYR